MRKPKNRAVTEALIRFSHLNNYEQELFISIMNNFLLSSSARQKNYIEQWEIEEMKTKNQSDGIGHENS